jgi:hypothetical protein
VGRLIGAFKTVFTRRINQFRDAPGARFWQRNYHEKIIRNERQMPKTWPSPEEKPRCHL